MIYFLLSFNLLIFSFFSFNLSMIFLIKKLVYLYEWSIYMKNFLMINLIYYFDWMSLMFISTIFLISSMVILYSMNYMENDLNINRFMFLIMIFVFSMIIMIISMNLIVILLGWDGLGLSSYCLVIYYQNKKSYNSGMITILMNRIGDIMILISISLMLKFNSWNFLFLNDLNDYIMYFMIFIASITKSAQIPFSTWLPLAMAAPTPVSSLVHSSTLVTAGVYLLIRLNYLFTSYILMLMLIISSFTMFFSGVSANFEFDLKKIIALSTLSQLGLMLFILSFSLPVISFFHLIMHAMFKSLLFLCSGIIIHNYFNNQDIRFISMNNFYLPYINLIFLMASLTLSGLPFMTGFYSKDLIIEIFNMKSNNLILYFILYFSMGLTVSYSSRLMYYLNIKILKNLNFLKLNFLNLMNLSILILIFLTIFFGSMMNWLIFNSLNFIFLSNFNKLLIFLVIFIGIFIGLLISKIINLKNLIFINFYKFFNMMFFLPLNLKKIKINYFKSLFFLIFNQDYGWNEYIFLKKYLYIINLNNFVNLFYKFNIFLLLMFIFYVFFIFLM
uniref:NADH dehydrogenase subunit 5 n=1 Tax=Apanteles gelechiidivoris TaxID=1911542 RepID=UPI00286CD3CD|nr:NADH dehydrogenase subunit 5 [Apanteles gelechiidivoris]WKW91666.1 NADH dehydrogenase subunit 5 [Apanteles gelechiidivoris]WLN31484.1 NADH dehydrogenase subunit 5 [Apanteles gelechiidivoris]